MTGPEGRDHLVERAARRLQSLSPDLAGLLPEQRQASPAPAAPAAKPVHSEPVQIPPQPEPAQPVTKPPRQRVPPPAAPIVDAPALRRAGLAPDDPGRNRVMEEFRLIQGRVLRAVQASLDAGAKGANTVLITSAKPGEGKTFSSLHLADSVARHGGRRVLLVDLDTKQNALSRLLALQDRPGFLSVQRSAEAALTDLAVDTCFENLSILPAGNSREARPAGNEAADLLHTVEALSRAFPDRILILDGPPCLSTSDPSILAPAVAQTVLVVQAEYTQRREVEASLELLQACPAVLLMLNKVKLYQNYTFGTYVDYKASAAS